MRLIAEDEDLYEILKVSSSATPVEIKKSYRKLCLLHHPDKIKSKTFLENDDKIDEKKATEKFQRIVLAYSILSDSVRRKQYDRTGKVSDDADIYDADHEDFLDFLNSFLAVNKINDEMIEQDRQIYQNSPEELSDLKDAFQFYEGDFLKLFEVIPHLEFTDAEETRIWSLINDAKNDFDLSSWKKWDKYVKNRNTIKKRTLKKLQKEAKEVEKMMQEKHKQDNKALSTSMVQIADEADLKKLIQSKNSKRFDSMIENLEKKYASGSSSSKKNKKYVKNGKVTKSAKSKRK